MILVPFGIILYDSGLRSGLTANKTLHLVISLCCIVLIAEGTRYLFNLGRRWFSGVFRVLLTILVGLLWIMVCLAAASMLKRYVSTGTWDGSTLVDSNIIVNNKKLYIGVWGFALLNASFILPVLLVSYEIIWHYSALRNAAREKEKLEKEKLRAELQQLKGIVNPHFLFNNLNSLSSLIAENPAHAQVFLDELTKVFRYLLRNNETELTTLAQEMEFIRSYYNLLQTRYGEAVVLNVHIEEGYGELLLPPLTLQLLVENAVKHNRIQKDNPLVIDLSTEPGNRLSVRNNLLKREGKVESTGIGLQNINARYRMLNQQDVLIEKNEQSFAAVITLIDANGK